MTLPYINVPVYITSYDTDPKTQTKRQRNLQDSYLQKERFSFLKIVRQELKAMTCIERGEMKIETNFFTGHFAIEYHPICPICSQPVRDGNGSMHEAILDRGDAEGLAFENYVQIFVPWNVVIVHEPKCHLIAQHYEIGRYLCIQQILKYYPVQKIDQWLDDLDTVMPSSLIHKARSHIMDINAWVVGSTVKAKILPCKPADFSISLKTIKSITPEEDRWYDAVDFTWTIYHPENHRDVKFVDNAMKANEAQLKLFPE